ncbi:uncharacterized protein LOC129912745 [Episyrphus balteatus]|uniref:uncharacterized protein LOC129912745 n=1 Tax=Episyrphus balteatus TaxID=286459 RepID=UPI002486CAB4|nr:uncharacterized protein LOC129912745 [Episyrphus balteatus]
MITHRLLAFEVLTAFLVLLLLQQTLMVQAFGYSYSRFIGPVRGPERQIIVHDRYDGRGRVDYVARPEYQFAYGVEDAKTRVLQNRRETRNGDAVKGVYSVVDPDGSLRVVKYTADNVNGFQAEVISNGVSTNHGQDNPLVAVHPDPQQLVSDDGRRVVGGGDDEHHQVNAKDEIEPRPNHHIQVQHPDKTSHEEEGAGPKKTEDINNESSNSKDASEYQEEDDDSDDGGKSSSESRNESQEKDDDDSSEEVEDY